MLLMLVGAKMLVRERPDVIRQHWIPNGETSSRKQSTMPRRSVSVGISGESVRLEW